MNKPEDAKKTWEQAIAKTTPIQLYSYARRLQSEKKDTEGMEIRVVAQLDQGVEACREMLGELERVSRLHPDQWSDFDRQVAHVGVALLHDLLRTRQL